MDALPTGPVLAGLEMLADYDWLTARRVETGGRPTILYSVQNMADV